MQGENLVRPAAGQHQQTDRGDCGGHHRALGFEPGQRRAEMPVLLGRQEPLAGRVAVLADMAGRPAARRHHPPVLREREHLRQDPDGLVGRRGPVPQLVVQRRHVLRSDILQGLLAERGEDLKLDGQSVVLGRPRLAPHRHEFLEEAVGKVGDGGLRRRLRRDRVLAPLDPVDDNSRRAPMLVDRLVADPSQGDPLQAGRSAGLDDVELAPGGVDPHAEAGQVAVPEDRVLALGLQPLHNPLGQLEGASLGHRRFPDPEISHQTVGSERQLSVESKVSRGDMQGAGG